MTDLATVSVTVRTVYLIRAVFGLKHDAVWLSDFRVPYCYKMAWWAHKCIVLPYAVIFNIIITLFEISNTVPISFFGTFSSIFMEKLL